MNDTGIKEQVIKEIIELAQQYCIEKVILFGSRARGDYHRASDIDLAVYGGNVAGFSLDVEEMTSTLLTYDVVDMNKNIDKIFIQFELGWKVLKELLLYEGNSVANTGLPREIIKAAYSIYTFIDEEIWISMLKERNNMTHIYDGNAAKELVKKIIDKYIPMFCIMKEEIEKRYQDILDTL